MNQSVVRKCNPDEIPEVKKLYLFVSLSARRMGVGSTIVSSLAEIYGVPLLLKCLVKNKDGMEFYRAVGYNIINTVLCGRI